MREDDLERILQQGSAAIAEAARPKPPEVIRARGNQRRRRKAAGTVLLALAIAAAGGGAYAGVRSGGGQPPAPVTHVKHPSPHVHKITASAAPYETMLPAGKAGSRAAIPWALVGLGWSLTDYSTGRPNAGGQWQQGGGQLTLALVDPDGGRYDIYQQANTGHPWALLAWSPDGRRALLGEVGTDPEQYLKYGVITLSTGSISTFAAPAGVTPEGFTRPDGTSILAVRQAGGTVALQRYTLAGALEATLASHAVGSTPSGCGLACGAISSDDGTTDIWSYDGHLELVNNAGGVIRDLPVPAAGANPSCTPLTWWDGQTVLARCPAPNQQQLWLVPAGGAAPTAFGPPVPSASDYSVQTGAWQLGGAAIYVNESAGSGCPQATGPSGSGIFQLTRGSLTGIPVPRSRGNDGAAVGVINEQLLVLARTGCPDSTSLL
ncbi:MAG TPA: hypothetical protein VGI31_10810 [Streptosporangiaceae bacterium]